jgi:hypothetical protein
MSTYIHAYSKQHTYDRMTCEDRGVFIIQLRCDEREREREREREGERERETLWRIPAFFNF